MIRLQLLVVFSICLAGSIDSQPPHQLLFNHITNSHGLSQANNDFLFKDSRGFVWISSVDGLNRFDGKQIKVYRQITGDSLSLSGQNIQGFFSEDKEGNIWFCTAKALNYYRRNQDNFISFLKENKNGKKNTGFYNCGMDQSGMLWLIKNDSLFHFSTSEKKFLLDSYHLFDGVERGKFYFNQSNSTTRFYSFSFQKPGLQITSFREGTVQREMLFDDQENGCENTFYIQQVYCASDSLVWLASDKGLIAFNPFDKTCNTYSYFNGKTIDFITGVKPYKPKILAITSSRHGLLFFNNEKREFINQFERTLSNLSIASNAVGNIYIDNDRGIWLTIDRIGVDYTSPEKIKFHSHFSSSNPKLSRGKISFNSFFELNRDTIWAGTFNQGIFILGKDKEVFGRITLETYPEGLPSNSIKYIFGDDQNRIWILTYHGLAYYDLKFKKVNFINNHYYLYGCQLKNGDILLSKKTGGIERVHTEHSTGNISLQGLPEFSNDEFYYLYENKGENLLYACKNLDSLTIINFKDNYRIEYPSLPLSGYIKDIKASDADSILWIATSYGLATFNTRSKDLSYYTTAKNLPNYTIYGIIPDNKQLWLSTNNGIVRLNTSDSTSQFYSSMDGFPSPEFNTFSSLKRADQEIWFGSSDGFITFYPDDIHSKLPIPKPQITSIKINDQVWDQLSCGFDHFTTNVSEVKSLILKHTQNTISFEFSAMEYSAPYNNQYKYLMKGVDDNWVYSGTNGFARYPNLPYGNHTFLIAGSDSDENSWGQKEIEIFIQTPIYLTTWFITLSGLLIVGIVWWIVSTYRKRKEKIQQLVFEKKIALERERLRIARDMHDDLGSGLSTLGLLANMILQKTHTVGLKEELTKVATLTDKLTQKVREAIWAVAVQNDPLEKLIVYLHKYASDLFENIDINCKIHLPDAIPVKTIFGESRRMIFLTFKEALNNIIKHSEATEAFINMDIQDNQLLISIQDNGKGFALTLLEQSPGNGLMNMRQRMSEIGGSCSIRTNPHGTSILLSIPV
ncbi:MAG: histidine kinase [Chitinophagales bacterium]|nr:histidine kinase [Chitinophagales bacterium]